MMDLGIFELIKQHGYSIIWLILGMFALFYLTKWGINTVWKMTMRKLDIMNEAVCDGEQGKIISHSNILQAICDLDLLVKAQGGQITNINKMILDFCDHSQSSRDETTLMIEGIKHEIEGMARNVEHISNESSNVYKLIAERLLNGHIERLKRGKSE
jgi:hypothetical protein